jgi:hypothetical protein
MSEHWVAVRTPAVEPHIAAESVRRFGLDLLGEHEGWIWGRGWPVHADTDEVVADLAGATGEPSIGGYVVDSDFGYVVGSASDGRVAFRLAVSEPSGERDERAHWLAQQWRSSELRLEAAGGLARWSQRFAPAAVTPEAVLHALRDDDDSPEPGLGPVYAEDAVREIFDGLGFPSLDRTVFVAGFESVLDEPEPALEEPVEPAVEVEGLGADEVYDDEEPETDEALGPGDEEALIEAQLRELQADLSLADPEEARITRVMIDVIEERLESLRRPG